MLLKMNGGACEGLVLLPQAFLLPFRNELAHDPDAETQAGDRRWSRLMEFGVQQTRLPVTAILEEVPMSLGDIANFRVGGLLSLERNDFTAFGSNVPGDVHLQTRAGGRPLPARNREPDRARI